MIVPFYMDVQVRWAITLELRQRGLNVLTAQEDGAGRFSDSDLMDRATNLRRVLFSFDQDMLRKAKLRQERGEPFGGLIYAHPLKVTTGQ